MIRRPPRSTLFPYPTLSRSAAGGVPATRCTAATTTRSGAGRWPRTSGCSRSCRWRGSRPGSAGSPRSEEHTSELQSRQYLVCRLLLEKKKKRNSLTLMTLGSHDDPFYQASSVFCFFNDPPTTEIYTLPLPDSLPIGCGGGAGAPLYRRYHDQEWGRPVAEDQRLFEKLSLEGFQAGLSWLTILRKRDHFREVFAGFDPAAVARFGPEEVDRLLADPGIVRNRAKIEATINNARRYADLAAEFGSLAAYAWRFEPDPRTRPAVLDHATLLQLGQSPESVAMSKDLRRRGWSFVGPT